MRAGLLNAYESIKAFSETDFTEDLKKIDVLLWSCTARMTRSFPVKRPRSTVEQEVQGKVAKAKSRFSP
jgi:non-heme chloroperoxidase